MRAFVILVFVCLSQLGYTQIDKDFFLIARNTGEKQLADSSILKVFGFAEDLSSHPKVPGPTLIVQEGDSVEIDLWNVSQGAPHTIHLHGLDVDQANDGVPHLSFEVLHMDHGYYRFEAPHAGTYLYHCHVASTIHVQAGMYGMIIVKERNNEKKTWTNGFDFDREFSFLSSEIDTNWHKDEVLDHAHGDTVKVIPVPPYHPQWFLVNGFANQQLINEKVEIYGAKNEGIYLRLANIGFYGNTYRFPAEMNAEIVSSDGRPLPQVEKSDSVVIQPGERYGVMLYPTDTFNGSMTVDYFNMNTFVTENTQEVAIRLLETASVPEIELQSIEVYPNPFKDGFQVHAQGPGTVSKLLIQDMNGKVLWSAAINHPSQLNQVYPTALPNGIYILQVHTREGAFYSKKLFKL